MLSRTFRALPNFGLAILWVSSLGGCTNRATDCHWNETCESSAGGSNLGGGGNAATGTAGGAGDAGGNNVGGSAGTSTSTTPPPCSRDLDDTNACAISTKYGVFVAPPPLGNDDTADGTPEKPYATLSTALSVAVKPASGITRSVFVCATAGDFTLVEQLTVGTEVDGVSIYGGLDCTVETTWKYDREAPPRSNFVSDAPLAFLLDGLKATVNIKNLKVTAAKPTEPGGSSIAMLVVNSPKVTLQNVELVANAAMKGKDGDPIEGSATPGTPGVPGTNACVEVANTVVFVPGASFVTTQCNGTEGSRSGGGGTGAINNNPVGSPIVTLTVGGPGANGTPEPVPNSSLFGYGGKGEQGANSPCENGKDGSLGLAGAYITGVTSQGTLSNIGYVPVDGNNGNDGTPGQGGGGGGGALAPTSCNYATAKPLPGASGGSGGSGGCGGKGGNGGKGGGASIALALLNSPISVIGCTLTSGNGGNGGAGASGQSGGNGGDPGAGGTAPSSGVRACRGGYGGDGGNGSAGGGGAGGDSAAIIYLGGVPTVKDSTLSVPTNGAPGGLDGNGTTTAAGAQGKVAKQLALKETV